VKAIKVTRVLDASRRRLPLQKKIGAGLTAGEFRLLVRSGRLGHVGLLESLVLLASGLGWKLDRWKETVRPRIAQRLLRTRYLTVPKGRVAGIHQIAVGYRRGKPAITLDLSMFIGADKSFDLVEIDGTPPIRTKVIGGVHGDLATVGSLVNAVPRLIESRKSGLLTVIDLAVPRTS
jgi:4-hydroxy-tetrahydrodipicolinate reductase